MADQFERLLLERHGPDEVTVAMILTGDIVVPSDNWALRQLGIVLPSNWAPAGEERLPIDTVL
jgi:hypothetical protein